MNTEKISHFLDEIGKVHGQDFMVMVLDGAPSHKCKDLVVPENITLVFLPPYSPELNPAELIWNELRRNYFVNKVFDSLNTATLQAENGLNRMSSNKQAVKSLTNWPWINVILNAK
jgi:transposase